MGEIKHIIHPFEPVYDASSKVLILGSFPSVVSREKNFYYMNTNNRFWKVMEALFQEEIRDKKQFCLDHHIALWDVIYSCTIKGSSDSSIQNVQVNDIPLLCQNSNIQAIFLTGKKAFQLYEKYIDLDVEHIYLPSTSSANAKMHLDQLVESYKVILEKL